MASRGGMTRVLQPVRYRKPGGVPAVATRWSIGAERDDYPETEWLLDPEGCRFVLVGRKSSETTCIRGFEMFFGRFDPRNPRRLFSCAHTRPV